MHYGLCFLFLLGFTFFLREVKDNAYAFFWVGGRGRGKQGFLWVICKWRIVLYSSTWNFIIIINIITSIGQYSLGIPWGSCLNVWFLAYDYWLPTTKETLTPNNKTPRGLNSIVLFLCLWWRYLQKDPNIFAGTTSRASKPSFFSADVELHVPAHQRGKFGIL